MNRMRLLEATGGGRLKTTRYSIDGVTEDLLKLGLVVTITIQDDKDERRKRARRMVEEVSEEKKM